MTITELLETIKELNNKHVLCNGESIRVHKIKSTVKFKLNGGTVLELDSITLDHLDGCRCPCGITFNLKKV